MSELVVVRPICAECRADGGGHHFMCSLAPPEYRLRQMDNLIAEIRRVRDRYERQVELTNIWHGRYEVLRHENNALRQKLKKQEENR